MASTPKSPRAVSALLSPSLTPAKAAPLPPCTWTFQEEGGISVPLPAMLPYFYLLTRLLAAGSKQSETVCPPPTHTHPMRPRFQNTSGSPEEEKGTTQAVSLNSHFCLPEQEDHQARFSLPARQPGNSLQAVDWGKCRPLLIQLSSRRDGFLVLSVSRSLKTIVAYSLSF